MINIFLYFVPTWHYILLQLENSNSCIVFFFFVSCHFLLVLMPIDKPIQEKANFEEQKQR